MNSYRVYSDVPLSIGLPAPKKFSHPTLKPTPMQCLKNSQEIAPMIRKKASVASLESCYFFETRNLSKRTMSIRKLETSQSKNRSNLKESLNWQPPESEYGINDCALRVWSPKYSHTTQVSTNRSITRFSMETMETQTSEFPSKALISRKNSLQINPLGLGQSLKVKALPIQENLKTLKMSCSSALPVNKRKQIIEQEVKKEFLSLKPVGESFKVNVLDNMKSLSLSLSSSRGVGKNLNFKKPIRVVSTPYHQSRTSGDHEVNELMTDLPKTYFSGSNRSEKENHHNIIYQGEKINLELFQFSSPRSQSSLSYAKLKT